MKIKSKQKTQRGVEGVTLGRLVHSRTQMYTYPPCLTLCLVRTSKKGKSSSFNVFSDVAKSIVFLLFNALGSLFFSTLSSIIKIRLSSPLRRETETANSNSWRENLLLRKPFDTTAMVFLLFKIKSSMLSAKVLPGKNSFQSTQHFRPWSISKVGSKFFRTHSVASSGLCMMQKSYSYSFTGTGIKTNNYVNVNVTISWNMKQSRHEYLFISGQLQRGVNR